MLIKILCCLSLFLGLLEAEQPSKCVLVTGGAGYIGTQICKNLNEAGFCPIAYDNLSNGHSESVKWGVFEKGDISDKKRLCEVIDKYHPLAVIHMAAFKAVGESSIDPLKFYANNVGGSTVLLEAMRDKKIDKIIFSSSAATYGLLPTSDPLKETDPCCPISPYGSSKLMVEKILSDCDKAYRIRYVSLRYFNVAGADLKGECGERGTLPQNLIPIILQVASQKRKVLEIFGNDYPTRDGTAIRDYVHVVDLADAHVRALLYLMENKPSIILNLGTGRGASVREVIDVARFVTKQPIPVRDVPRRPGDPAFLTADFKLAKECLGWEPKHSDLSSIIQSEWNWNLSLNR